MRFFPALIIFLISNCSADEGFETVVEIPDVLRPFVDNFLREAEARGYPAELTNLIIRFDDYLNGAVCGRCNSDRLSGNIQKIISIRTMPCWENEFEQEALIMHELGHCVLGRQHSRDTLPNGAPKSIMIPFDLTIYGPCIYPIGDKDCDKRYRREYYLDELFDESAPVPSWGN